MWKQFCILGASNKTPQFLVRNVISPLLNSAVVIPVRTTFILKRRYGYPLNKINQPPVRPRERQNVYELVEDTNTRKHELMKLILTEHVAGYGNRGTIVSVRPNFGYYHLLLPRRAVYASPENLEKYSSETSQESVKSYSSPHTLRTLDFLSRYRLRVWMNRRSEWEIEPWHVRSSFRVAGIHVAEYAIEMPEKRIAGPSIELEGKIFVVNVTMNNRPDEKAPVRCFISYHDLEKGEKLPQDDKFWVNIQPEYVFPEEAHKYTFPEDEPVKEETFQTFVKKKKGQKKKTYLAGY